MGRWLFICWRLLSAHRSFFKNKADKVARNGDPYPPFGDEKGAVLTLGKIAELPLEYDGFPALYRMALQDAWRREQRKDDGETDYQHFAALFYNISAGDIELL